MSAIVPPTYVFGTTHILQARKKPENGDTVNIQCTQNLTFERIRPMSGDFYYGQSSEANEYRNGTFLSKCPTKVASNNFTISSDRNTITYVGKLTGYFKIIYIFSGSRTSIGSDIIHQTFFTKNGTGMFQKQSYEELINGVTNQNKYTTFMKLEPGDTIQKYLGTIPATIITRSHQLAIFSI